VAERRRNEGVLLGVRTGPLPGSSEKRVVLDVLPGSPAEDAGVLPGWILLRCDGRRPGDVLGVGKLADGQVVRCEFLDGDSGERVLDLAARPVSLRPVRKTAELAEGVVLLRFDLFDAASARWLRRELAAHAGAPGLVLDLRHNSGGTWAAMADILEAFFDEAVPIGTTLERAGGVKRHRVKPGWEGSRFSAPIVVLVSDRSASAAEIFAHVVQHHRRGTIVGAKTAGVVLASVEWRLPGGGELHLSLFDYRGADGRRLEGAGVAPDVVVDPPAAGRPGERDPAIAAALEVLGNGSLDPQPPAWGREMQPPTSGGG
jgi:carboxyl-terminal processing protease